MTLNPHVVLAALDSMLETPSTHPGTHLSIMRQRAERLREQVRQHIPGPTAVDPLSHDEQAFVRAVLADANVEGVIAPMLRKVFVTRQAFHTLQRHVGTEPGEPYAGVIMGNVAVVVMDRTVPRDLIAVEEYLAEHGSTVPIIAGAARHAFAAGWDARSRHGEETQQRAQRDQAEACPARLGGEPHCACAEQDQPCCYCER